MRCDAGSRSPCSLAWRRVSADEPSQPVRLTSRSSHKQLTHEPLEFRKQSPIPVRATSRSGFSKLSRVRTPVRVVWRPRRLEKIPDVGVACARVRRALSGASSSDRRSCRRSCRRSRACRHCSRSRSPCQRGPAYSSCRRRRSALRSLCAWVSGGCATLSSGAPRARSGARAPARALPGPAGARLSIGVTGVEAFTPVPALRAARPAARAARALGGGGWPRPRSRRRGGRRARWCPPERAPTTLSSSSDSS